MATQKDLLERQKEVSGQVSAQTRTSALGLLAISWALLTAHDQPLEAMAAHVPQYQKLALAVLGMFVLVFDMLQYVSATKDVGKALAKAEKDPNKEADYDYDAFTYKAILRCYRLKFSVLTIAGILLALIFMQLFIG